MKKCTNLFSMILILGFVLVSCKNVEETELPVSTSTKVVIPTVTQKPVNTPEPTMNENASDNKLGEWLVDSREIWFEDAQAMAANQGGQFGPGSNKAYNSEEGVFVFSDSEGTIWTRLNTNLDEWEGSEPLGNQAILVKWQASTFAGMSFNFIGRENAKEFSIQIGNPCSLARIEGIEEFSGDLEIGEDTWFYTLMAMDNAGNFRSVIWQAENPDNQGSYSAAFGDEYAGDSWRFILGSTGQMVIKVAEYGVYSFTEFAQ